MSIAGSSLGARLLGPSRESPSQACCPPAAVSRSAQRAGGRQRRICAAAVLSPPVLPFQRGAQHLQHWTPDTWRSRDAKQQPEYPDAENVAGVVEELSRMPPLIFAGECRNLQARLAACSTGEAFWLQGTASPRACLLQICLPPRQPCRT